MLHPSLPRKQDCKIEHRWPEFNLFVTGCGLKALSQSRITAQVDFIMLQWLLLHGFTDRDDRTHRCQQAEKSEGSHDKLLPASFPTTCTSESWVVLEEDISLISR